MRQYLDNEPERSRRVLRLAFANWPAHLNDQGPGRRKPPVRAVFSIQKVNTSLPLFAPAPDAPAAVRALSPNDLATWITTTRDVPHLLFEWPWPAIRSTERRDHHALVILLAEELYYRERGSLPPSEDALLGRYLDHLPDDGSSDVDDGTAQRVEDSRALEQDRS